MFQVIGDPIVQPLGYQGDHFCFKLVFPTSRVVYAQDPSASWGDTGPGLQPHGYYGAVFKVRAEDLPQYLTGAELLHIDIGRLLREKAEREKAT